MPKFGTEGAQDGGENFCQAFSSDDFTGYEQNNGAKYCYQSSDALDQNPHLVLHSGKIGAVLDANVTNGSLFKKLGSLTGMTSPSGQWTAKEVYDDSSLPIADSSLTATFQLDCSSSSNSDIPQSVHTARIGIDESNGKAVFGGVRQGHAVNHIVVNNLVWLDTSSGQFIQFATSLASNDQCTATESLIPNPDNGKCNQDYGAGNSYPCLDAYYNSCRDFVQ